MFNSTLTAQENFECIVGPDLLNAPESFPSPYSGSIDPAVLAGFEPKVFNVTYWQVNDKNGNFGVEGTPGDLAMDITKQQALKSIAYLNQQYNQYRIFFKYRGVNQLDSPSIPPSTINSCSPEAIDDFSDHGYTKLYRCIYTKLKEYAIASGNFDNNSINAFLVSSTVGFAGAALSANTIIQTRDDAENGVVIHEIGHTQGLSHTFLGFTAVDGTINRTNNECEHVTRDPLNPFFNAIVNADTNGNGDRVLDTNAVPSFHHEYCWNNNLLPISSQACQDAIYYQYPQGLGDYNIQYTHEVNPVIDDCYYIGSGKDCEETLYDIAPGDVQNWMAYTPRPCRSQFTIGQAIRMHEHIEDHPQNYQYLLEDDFSSLYEPYEGEYYNAGPYDPTMKDPLFQPGFDYKFVKCEGPYPQPAPFNENFTFFPNQVVKSVGAFETDFSTIFHPNHTAININQIDIATSYVDVEKCYNNYNRNPKGGKVTKFNDGVFNYNITETPKDSIGINNSNLIPSLDPGLYKVEKDYHDGTTIETIIQKGND